MSFSIHNTIDNREDHFDMKDNRISESTKDTHKSGNISNNNVLKVYVTIDSIITKETILPSTAYIEGDQISDTMYDSFVITPSNNYLYDYKPIRMKEFVKSDWQNYINNVQFAKGLNVDAIEEAVGETKTALGRSDYKAGIFLSLLFPVRSVTSFGEIDGKDLDFSKLEDRIAGIKWMVDEQIRQFEARNYKHIEIAGFFWFYESIRIDEDAEMLRAVTDYVRSLGHITIWGPFFKARGYDRWTECNFDKASMQANYFPGQTTLPNHGPVSRIMEMMTITKNNGMGIELELSNHNPAGVTGFKQYIKTAVEQDRMDDYHFYWMRRNGTEYLCRSEDPYVRSAYNELYRFIKKTLKSSDMLIDESFLPDDDQE